MSRVFFTGLLFIFSAINAVEHESKKDTTLTTLFLLKRKLPAELQLQILEKYFKLKFEEHPTVPTCDIILSTIDGIIDYYEEKHPGLLEHILKIKKSYLIKKQTFFEIQKTLTNKNYYLIDVVNNGINYHAPFNSTPLTVALEENDEQVVDLLLLHGADPNMASLAKRYPLHEAWNASMVKKLIDNGADVNCKNEYGWTPLHRFSYSGDTQAMMLLIQAGAEINALDRGNNTPLSDAVFQNQVAATLLLLNHGATQTHRNVFRQTPLDCAQEWRRPKLINLLKARRESRFKLALNFFKKLFH